LIVVVDASVARLPKTTTNMLIASKKTIASIRAAP
jgi:hypothetical protein